MGRKRVFFASFALTLCLMLACYGLMYRLMGGESEAQSVKRGVSMSRPGARDSKTLLLRLGEGEGRMFFILKFNAIQNKVGIIAVSPSYDAGSGSPLWERLDRAGAMGRLMDLADNLGIQIDYYLKSDFRRLAYAAGELEPVDLELFELNLPPALENFALKRSEFLDADTFATAAEKAGKALDSEAGLAFRAQFMYGLIKTNIGSLSTVGEGIKADYRRFDTNLDSRAMDRFSRILRFLCAGEPEYPSRVIYKTDDASAAREKALAVTG